MSAKSLSSESADAVDLLSDIGSSSSSVKGSSISRLAARSCDRLPVHPEAFASKSAASKFSKHSFLRVSRRSHSGRRTLINVDSTS